MTAPLRRLADRFCNEVVIALCAGIPPPAHTVAALPELPALMAASHDRAGELERRIVDFVEAAVLESRVGEVFQGVITEVSKRGGTVQLRDPAVRGRCDAHDLPLGEEIQVRLVEADPDKGIVSFVPVGDANADPVPQEW